MDKEEIKEYLAIAYEVTGSDEFAEIIAKSTKNIFDKLMAKGFSRSESLQILCSISNKK